MAKLLLLGSAVIVSAFALVAFLWSDRQERDFSSEAEFPLAQLLAASADNEFARVPNPWEFVFPADHGRHSEYRTEWWNVTGTLEDNRGSELGLQILFLRTGLVSEPPERQSQWATSEVYAGLASVSHPFRRDLVTGDRLSRGALDLAGTSLEPMRIWVEDWQLEGLDQGEVPIDLRAELAVGDVELALELDNSMPLVDTGDISMQTTDQLVPFQFYIQPHLEVAGSIRTPNGAVDVVGHVSFEHAWGELPLPGGPVARDRFTIYFDDQRVLFVILTHRVDGTGTSTATGLLVPSEGRPAVLAADDLELVVIDHWNSARSGAQYPISWVLRIPAYEMEMELVPETEDQEGGGWANFWAGPISVLDTDSVSFGRGFVQLYGYDSR